MNNHSFINQVYAWMFGGLIVTSLTAYIAASNEQFVLLLISNDWLFYSLLAAELLVVIFLSSIVKKISSTAVAIWLIIYSILSGLTFSAIFLVYSQSSVTIAFLSAAGMFGATALYGYFTKHDLSTLGSVAMMGLFGLILASGINIFVGSSNAEINISWIGILIFAALTAYDMQKIKLIDQEGNDGTDDHKKEALMGAFTLYLDFINLFLNMLRIFGKRK